MKIINYSVIIILLLLTAGCVTSNRDDELRRIALLFNASEVGESFVIESDTLLITDFKFAISRFNLYSNTDVILQTGDEVTALIFAYTDEVQGDRLILDVDMGIRDVDTFQEYEIFLEPVASRTNIFDDDFFGEDQNYSVIISGTINSLPFIFRSSATFDKSYLFDPVTLGDNRETLTVLKKISMLNLFEDAEGKFLNPVLKANEELIVSNIENSLVVEVSSSSIFGFLD